MGGTGTFAAAGPNVRPGWKQQASGRAVASARYRRTTAACGGPRMCRDAFPQSLAAFIAASSFALSASDSCGRSTLIVSFSSVAVSGKGGW